MDVFTRVLCKENIKLEPKFISSNFQTILKEKLINKVEGICTKHGFIKPNSIQIYKICPGLVELISLAGYVVYDVHFYADICNPLLGSIIKATVTNINRFGVLAEAGKNEFNKSVLEIIIAKNSVNIQSEIDLEDCKIGDEIKIEIIRKKYELGDKKICAIGRAVKNVIVATKKEKIIDIIGENDPEDEVEVDEELSDEEESDEESEEEEEEEEEAEIEEEESKHGGSDFFSDDNSIFADDDVEEDFDDDDKDGDISGGGDDD